MKSPAGSSLYWSKGGKTESRLTDGKLIGSLLLKHAEGTERLTEGAVIMLKAPSVCSAHLR